MASAFVVPMSDVLEFFFDFSSPYGYFASLRVDALAEGGGRRAVWRPFMLGVAFKETGNRPLGDQPLKGDYCRYDWQRMSRLMGVPWVLPDPFPIATLAASRAFYWLDDRDSAIAKDFAKGAYHAYFGEGRDIREADVLAAIAEPLGVDPGEMLPALSEPAAKQRLKDETARALDRGVCGSPFIIVDGEPFWGSDRLWMVKKHMAGIDRW